MARVTVEDCVDKVPNRFELVLLSAHRARAMSAGAELTMTRTRLLPFAKSLKRQSCRQIFARI